MTNELNINGLEEITSFIGTRKEIYNLIAKHNPMAIIDYRQAFVKIEEISYLIILKKIDKAFKVSIIWRLGEESKQFHF